MVLAHNVDEGLRTRDIKINQDVTFESMLLSSTTLQGLRESGFYKPSPVQLQGIPLGKCGFDLLLEAKSGTGKTAVFSVIALEKLDLSKGLQVVILAPTREIASQICDVIRQIGIKYEGLNVEVVMGGLPVEEDISKFKKNVHIVVGSPGRLRHLVQDKYIDVSFVRLLVFDEADRLMDKSFLPDINFIFSILPLQKQVILSSATYTENTKMFIKKYVHSAQHICPDSNCVLLGVEQKFTVVKFNANIVRQTQNRFDELLKILAKKAFKQCLIFCNYQARVTEVHKLLIKYKWPVEQLYGQQEQTDRLGALKTLQDYKCRILIATDLAARGIDACNVDLVVNFEPPFEWQTYLHRIGRAGRFGSYGMSITILSEGKEEKKFREMLDLLNVSLHIDSFWTSEKKELNTAEILEPQITTLHNCVENTTENGIKYQELWNELTGDHHLDNIENFESLCHSFEETKATVVESFDDLLKSFQSKQVPAKIDEYQHLQIASPEIEKYCDSLRVLKKLKGISKLDTYNTASTMVCKDTGNTKNNNTIKKEVIDEISCNNENNKKWNNNLNLKKSIVNDSPKATKGDSKDSGSQLFLREKSNEDTITENSGEMLYSTALLDAGLPMSFASTKENKKYISNKCITKQKVYLTPETTKTETCHHNNNSKNIKRLIPSTIQNGNENYHLYKDKQLNNRKNNDARDSYGKCNAQNEDINKHEHLNNQTHNFIRDAYRKSNHSHQISEDSDSDDSDMNVSENYITWYKQLKFRMKQLDLALYVEEMSLL